MEIPILLGANPKTADPNISIPVRFSRWHIRLEGLVDSELILRSDFEGFEDHIIKTNSKMNGAIYPGPCQVRMQFDYRGTERAISVFAVEHK